MDKNDFIKVWISPEDVCLLAAIRGGRTPASCAQRGNSFEDHILVKLSRKDIQTLWKLGGCRNSKTGGPLLGPDGRLVCAFEGTAVPAPGSVSNMDSYEGPRSKEDYDKQVDIYKNVKNARFSEAEEAKNIRKKARMAAHKLVSKKDIFDPTIERAHDYERCVKNNLKDLDDSVKGAELDVQRIQKDINAGIHYGDDRELHQYREHMEKLRDDLASKIETIYSKTRGCILAQRKAGPETYHTSGKRLYGLFGRPISS